MTDYTKTTNFTAKDSLPSGNAAKKILGNLFDTEFDAISTAIASKSDASDTNYTSTLSTVLINSTIDDASNTSVTPIINLTHTTSGTPGTGIGTAVDFIAETSASNNETGMRIAAVTTDVTPGSEDFDFVVNLMAAGSAAAEKLRVTSAGVLSTTEVAVTTVTASGNIAVSGTVDGRDVATDGTKLDGIEAAADVTDATNVDAAGAVMNSDATTAAMSFVIDEDAMGSDSATKVPTQQSTKAYVDAQLIAANSLSGALLVGNSTGGTDVVVTAGDVVTTDTINETTAAAGVTIDGVLIKDGLVDGRDVSADGTALDNIDTTLATLTQTLVPSQQATLTLSSAVTAGVPAVSVTKEVVQSGVSNGAWDVNSTTENYTRVDSAAATTLDWVGFDVSTASFVDSFSVASQEIVPEGIAFSTDGTKMFIVGSNGDDVNEYALSAGFDVSTATFTDAFSVAAQDTIPRGLAFNTDGTKMFVVGQTGQDVNEYTLSTGFDVSTATFVDAFSVSAQETTPKEIAFNTDGTKMFIVGSNGDDVNEYTLGTGFDVSTATYSQNFSVSAQETEPTGIAFNTDGTKMYIVGAAGDDVNEYTLSTGFDVSTASYSQNFSVSAQDTSPSGIAFNTDGSKMFIVGTDADNVNEYDLSYSSVALGTGSFASADVGKTIEANSGEFVLTATDGSYVETTAPTSYDQVASGSWSMYGVVYNTVDGDLELSGGLFDPYDVSTAVFVDSFSVSGQGTTPDGIAFNTDGTKIFVCDFAAAGVSEYALSTGFDVSTATFTDTFSVSTQDTSPSGIAFNTDGTKLFVVGTIGDDVNEYALSTGFDVSTASFTDAFLISGQDTAPAGIAFSTDGTKMFVVGRAGQDVNEYTLSTGFDVSTSTFVDSFSVSAQDTNPQGIAFNTTGTKMFVVGSSGNDVNEYTLSTAFDVSTASFVDSFSVADQDTAPTGLAFSADGAKMFVVGNTGNDVNEYDVGTIASLTGYHAAHTTTSIDSTYWTDINSMTATEAVGDGNVYYAISTDDRTTWGIVDNTSGERDIVRNNVGTWEYNSNGTYASETWTSGTTNTELATLAEAMGTAQNLMDKTQLEAVTDANQVTLANDLDLAIVFNLTSGTTMPSSDGVAINYDANTLNESAVIGTDYDWDFPATDKVRVTALTSGNYKVRVV